MRIDLPLPREWASQLNPFRELYVTHKIIKYNVSAAVVPGLILSIAAWNHESASLGELAVVLGKSTLYFLLYIYTFILLNQLDGVDEDQANKPDRPLVTGLITVRGARVRWVISMALYLGVSYWLDVLIFTMLWQIVGILHNYQGWSKHWITKNISMVLGVIAQLGAAWHIATPVTAPVAIWIIALACIMFPLFSLQDMRDVAGDIKNNRKTFPIAVGDTASRVVLGLGFGIFLPLITHFGLMMPFNQSPLVIGISLGMAVLSVVIGIRTWIYRTPEADHQTYMLYTYWYCAVVASAIAVF